VTIYLLVCPYTKVEESFNLQATHDLLFHRNHIEKYDHHEFPGVVPRSFIGPLFLSLFSFPFSFFVEKFYMQYIVRWILGATIVLGFSRLRRKVSIVYGKEVGIFLILVTCAQFHMPFYFTRTLPNTFALALVIFAYSYWFEEKYFHCFGIITFAGVIFRGELVLLLFPMVLLSLIQKKLA